MNIKTVIGSLVIAVLLFFGLIFAIASSVAATGTRLTVALLLFIAAFAVAIVLYVTRPPKKIVQQIEVSGEMKAVPIKCPNCGGNVTADKIRIVENVPYATCPYCGHTFEVAEEPKW